MPKNKEKEFWMHPVTIILSTFSFIVFMPLVYMIIWTLTLMNMVESPLPESEEKVPDLGVVESPIDKE